MLVAQTRARRKPLADGAAVGFALSPRKAEETEPMSGSRRIFAVLPTLAVVTGLAFLAHGGAVWAQGSNPVFTVSDIPVDATAASAAAAREAARIDGQRRAFAA